MKSILVLAMLLLGSSGRADEAPAAKVESVKPEPKWYERIKFEGLAEGYFSYRLQGGPANRTNELRAFDTANNAFTPSFGKLAASLAAEPAGFRIDLAFGPVAELGSPDLGTAGAEVYKHLLQAYASVKLFDLVVVDLGKFVTSAGAEVFENSNNWLFSRSMIFEFGPYTHAGLRVTVPVHKTVTLQASVVNGWDAITTASQWKTFNVSAVYTPSDDTTVAFNFYGGPQSTPAVRGLFDVVVTQKVGKLGLNGNAIFGFEGGSKWYAAAMQAKYTFAERVRVAARLEYFGDPDGHRTGFANAGYLNTTVGVGIVLANPGGIGTVELRPELRHDQALTVGGTPVVNGSGSTSQALTGDVTPFVGGTSAGQTTAQLAMVAWF